MILKWVNPFLIVPNDQNNFCFWKFVTECLPQWICRQVNWNYSCFQKHCFGKYILGKFYGRFGSRYARNRFWLFVHMRQWLSRMRTVPKVWTTETMILGARSTLFRFGGKIRLTGAVITPFVAWPKQASNSLSSLFVCSIENCMPFFCVTMNRLFKGSSRILGPTYRGRKAKLTHIHFLVNRWPHIQEFHKPCAWSWYQFLRNQHR